MRRALGVLLAVMLTGAVMQASEFDWIARHVEQESGCRRTHIPFFGLARFAVAVGHPAGASELNLAVFEHTDISPVRFSEIVNEAAGSFWKPILRVRSSRGQSTTIFAQHDGQRVRLLIGNLDHGEATLVEVRVNVEQLMRFIDDHQHKSRE